MLGFDESSMEHLQQSSHRQSVIASKLTMLKGIAAEIHVAGQKRQAATSPDEAPAKTPRYITFA